VYTEETRAHAYQPSEWAVSMVGDVRSDLEDTIQPASAGYAVLDPDLWYRDSVDYYLDRVLPGLNAPRTLGRTPDWQQQPFRRECMRPKSSLFHRIMPPHINVAYAPNLSLKQLAAVALLSRPDRTAGVAEMAVWLTVTFPYFSGRYFALPNFTTGFCSLYRHLCLFFARCNDHYDGLFVPIDPASRSSSQGDTTSYPHLVWYLPPGNENRIFRLDHEQPYDHIMQSSRDSTLSSPLLDLPLEILRMIIGYLFKYQGTIHVIRRGNGRSGCLVSNPVSMPSVTRLGSNRLGGDTPHTNGDRQWITLPMSLFEIPQLRQLALFTFFHRNTFAIMPDGPDMPHRPATFLAREWLHPSQPSIHGRGYLRRVVIALDFKTLQRRQIEGVLATLGGVLDPLITLVIHNSTLTLTTLERGNPALIPGMQTLRRFRGCRNINIVVDIPMPNLSAMARTWSTTPHLQHRPTQAFLPQPYAQSTLMSRHNLSELRALAVQYGHDPSRYTQLPDGGDPKKRKTSSNSYTQNKHMSTTIPTMSNSVESHVLARDSPLVALL
jgi:hypothetical protein